MIQLPPHSGPLQLSLQSQLLAASPHQNCSSTSTLLDNMSSFVLLILKSMLSTPSGKSSCPYLLSFYPQSSPLSSSKPSSSHTCPGTLGGQDLQDCTPPPLFYAYPSQRLSVNHAYRSRCIYTCQVSPLLLKSMWARSAALFRGPIGGQAGE